MLQIVRNLWTYYVAWQSFWILGSQWSKMAEKKCQDVFLAISDINLSKKSYWQELRKKSHDGFFVT